MTGRTTNKRKKSKTVPFKTKKKSSSREEESEPTVSEVNEGRLSFKELTSRELYEDDEKKRNKKFFKAENVDEILDLIEEGSLLEDAAKLIYLEPTMVKKWYDDNYKNFKMAVDQAEAFCKHAQIQRVVQGMRRSSNSMWWLERRYKMEYNKDANIVPPSDSEEETQYMRIGGKVVGF